MKRYLGAVLVLSTIKNDLFAAEAGMPQLDPTYWASQTFWLILVFLILYISLAKFYLPKIKKNLDDRENKIKEDLDEANNLKTQSEKKLKEYEVIIENSKKEVTKILLDSKNILDKDINNKKVAMEKEIEIELSKAQKEILDLKKNSINSINIISQEITSNIIEKVSGDKLNESSVKATVEDIAKKNIGKYL
jgi:F-type H+-transporting ATPase subunit b